MRCGVRHLQLNEAYSCLSCVAFIFQYFGAYSIQFEPIDRNRYQNETYQTIREKKQQNISYSTRTQQDVSPSRMIYTCFFLSRIVGGSFNQIECSRACDLMDRSAVEFHYFGLVYGTNQSDE